MQEVMLSQGVGIQVFRACRKQGLLAYVTQVRGSRYRSL
jgi:hypothetical protein